MKLKKGIVSNQNNNIENEITDLQQGLALLNIKYDKNIVSNFQKYIKILYTYKNKLHLLSHRDYNYISKRHFLPSLMAFDYIKNYSSACDIGAGAGFPSIPLKLLGPEIKFTLFESKKKKAEFLRHLVRELGLSDITIIDKRAEQFKEKRFKLILLKAVGKIKRLVKTIDNLIEPDGCAIFYKSHQVESEIKTADKELKKRCFRVQVEKLFTPIENLPLALVILKKE